MRSGSCFYRTAAVWKLLHNIESVIEWRAKSFRSVYSEHRPVAVVEQLTLKLINVYWRKNWNHGSPSVWTVDVRPRPNLLFRSLSTPRLQDKMQMDSSENCSSLWLCFHQSSYTVRSRRLSQLFIFIFINTFLFLFIYLSYSFTVSRASLHAALTRTLTDPQPRRAASSHSSSTSPHCHSH